MTENARRLIAALEEDHAKPTAFGRLGFEGGQTPTLQEVDERTTKWLRAIDLHLMGEAETRDRLRLGVMNASAEARRTLERPPIPTTAERPAPSAPVQKSPPRDPYETVSRAAPTVTEAPPSGSKSLGVAIVLVVALGLAYFYGRSGAQNSVANAKPSVSAPETSQADPPPAGTPNAEEFSDSEPTASQDDGQGGTSPVDGSRLELVASSVLPGGDHGVPNLVDGDRETAWAEGSPGSGGGESIDFRFKDGARHTIARIEIVAGYDKVRGDAAGDRWTLNNRPGSVLFISDRGTRATIGLDKSDRGYQRLDLPPRPAVNEFTLVFNDVVRGRAKTSNDLCVSEIRVYEAR